MFAATRAEPAWIGAALAVGLLILLALGATLTGRWELLADRGGAIALLTQRDARGGVLFVVLLAYVVTARRYTALGAASAFDALGPLFAQQRDLDVEQVRSETVEAPTDARVRTRRALWASGIAPLVAFAIDRDVTLYLSPEYWNYEQAWQWFFGIALCWNLGLFLDATLEYGRRFGVLARRLDRVDLLEAEVFAPFASLGLRAALLWLVMVAIFALNLADAGYLSAVIGLSALSLGLAAAGALPPMLSARARVHTAKREELARIAAALRGQDGALRGSLLEARAADVDVADLLAYRTYIESLSEWPFDAPMLLRLLLYVAIPVGSWVGGAFVEQLLEGTIGG